MAATTTMTIGITTLTIDVMINITSSIEYNKYSAADVMYICSLLVLSWTLNFVLDW